MPFPFGDVALLEFWHNSMRSKVVISIGFTIPTTCIQFADTAPCFREADELIKRLFVENGGIECIHLSRPYYLPFTWEPFESFTEHLKSIGFEDPRNNGDKCDVDDTGKKNDNDHEDHEDEYEDEYEDDTPVLCLERWEHNCYLKGVTKEQYMMTLAHLCLRRQCRNLPTDALFRILDLVRRD